MNAERNLPPRCGQVWKSMENEIVREFLTKILIQKVATPQSGPDVSNRHNTTCFCNTGMNCRSLFAR